MAATADLDAEEIDPGFGTSRVDDDNTLRVDFGGNYSQRSSDGINSKRQLWTVVYDNLTTADLVKLMDFLRPLGSTTAFLWTPPRQSTQLQFTVERGSLTETPKVGNAVSDVNVTYKQEFDL